jgi:hypothetical protein
MCVYANQEYLCAIDFTLIHVMPQLLYNNIDIQNILLPLSHGVVFILVLLEPRNGLKTI